MNWRSDLIALRGAAPRALLFLLLFTFGSVGLGSAQDALPTAGMTIHVVQRGETLFRIAQTYGLTVDELARINGLADPDNIEVGQRLLIPTGEGVLPESHTVQPGESLQSIANLYGVTVEDLARINSLPDINTLFVGQVLALSQPVSVPLASSPTPIAPAPPTLPAEAVATAAPTADPIIAPTSPPVSVPVEAPVAVAPLTLHTVQRGETLFRIATAYGVTVNAMVEANSLSAPDVIYAGQTLVVPVGEQDAPDLPPPVQALQIYPLIFTEGQTGMIRLITAEAATVVGTWRDTPLNIAAEENSTRHTALVGIPLGTAPGVYPLALEIAYSGGTQSVSANIQVVSGIYSVESLTLLEDRGNLLAPAVEDAELLLLQNVMRAYNPTRLFSGAMGLPAAATITSPFGAVRSYNGGEFSRTHLGTDFAGIPGTPIYAPAAGVVVMADTLNIRGLATVIDHGWGVYTGYWHQTEQYVSVGDTITPGQVIGTIGSSGRVSGPHLHWELWVNGTPVDPMQWSILDFS